jgi:hypothetical protein
MWFELQKVGIQSTSYSIKSLSSSNPPNLLGNAFAGIAATSYSIEEGVKLARRVGARSIISIGSAHILSSAKAIRTVLECGHAAAGGGTIDSNVV